MIAVTQVDASGGTFAAIFEGLTRLSWPIAIFAVARIFKNELSALISRISKVKHGDTEVSFEEQLKEIKRQTEDNTKQVNAVENLATNLAAQPVAAPLEQKFLNVEKTQGTVTDDPWKGQFGGKSKINNRGLTASVEAILGRPDWFRVSLTVDSTNQGQYPLSGVVKFFLHNSFPQPLLIVPVGRDGKAFLQFSAWGAFTVGVLADDGQTPLELDLSEDTSFPETFRTR